METNCIARTLTVIAIYAAFGGTFLLAGGSKFMERKVPDWFKAQFGKSFLNVLPGLAVSYWTIALLEILVPLLLIVSLIKSEFLLDAEHFYLQIAIALSSVIFAMLGFGLRLANDFQGAANLFFYFVGTLFAQFFVSKII